MLAWLQQQKINDPIQRPFAEILQVILLVGVILTVLAVPFTLIVSEDPAGRTNGLLVVGTAAAAFGAGLVVLRRGALRAAFVLFALGLLGVAANGLVRAGLTGGTPFLLILLTLLGVSVLLNSRIITAAFAILIFSGIVGVAILEAQGSTLVGQFREQTPITINALSLFVVSATLLLVFVDRYGAAMRRSLYAAASRERELDTLRAGLEQTVATRTHELQTMVDQLRASQETIRELGAPILPVLPGVLVAPLIGVIDSTRATNLSESVLEAVSSRRVQHLVLDLTGVSVVDTQVVKIVLQLATAVRLLGTQPWLVGIRAEVAHTIVHLGAPLDDIRVLPNLQEAVAALSAGGGGPQYATPLPRM